MGLKILYTLCSANHLAYAKTMASSFIKHNPEYRVYIGLVDKINNRFDTDYFSPATLVEIEDMGIAALAEMSERYTILELNCALKPFFARYLVEKLNPEILLYSDTDIFYCHSLQPLETELEGHDILLSPHITKPVFDNKFPDEKEYLRTGIYNAGFIAMKRGAVLNEFLQWWAYRMRLYCYLNLKEGYMVDQNWLNLVPVFFKSAGVIKHKGANVAFWNLQEKMLATAGDKVFVDDAQPLLFLHISGYRFEEPDKISRYQTRHDLNNFPILKQLFGVYTEETKQNKYDDFIKMDCFYAKKTKKPTGIMAFVNRMIKPVGIKIIPLEAKF